MEQGRQQPSFVRPLLGALTSDQKALIVLLSDSDLRVDESDISRVSMISHDVDRVDIDARCDCSTAAEEAVRAVDHEL